MTLTVTATVLPARATAYHQMGWVSDKSELPEGGWPQQGSEAAIRNLSDEEIAIHNAHPQRQLTPRTGRPARLPKPM